jgi:Flp pilus assembly protein TadB
MLPLPLEDKMAALAASEHTQTPAKRDPRLYFWIASTGAALIGVGVYLLAPTPEVALYSLLFLAPAYLISWTGILLGKRA